MEKSKINKVIETFMEKLIENSIDGTIPSYQQQVELFFQKKCFDTLSIDQIKEIKQDLEVRFFDIAFTSLLYTLYMFEMETTYKIIYEDEETKEKISLAEAHTEGLYAELSQESGWIFQYSKKLTDEMKERIKERLNW